MRLEHSIFLTLIITAAIITGSTLGVAANFPLILGQNTITPQQPAAVQLSGDTVPVSGDHVAASRSLSSVDVMVITAAEKKQIVEMLKSLGMADEADLTAFIKAYQERHALDATGLLDSKTLHFIIQEAKLLRVENVTRQASL